MTCPVCDINELPHPLYEKWGYSIQVCGECGLGSTAVGGGFDPSKIYDEGYFTGARADGYGDYLGSEPVLRAEFRRAVEELRRHGARGGKLLEVGCAYGFFLSEASVHFDCVGVEMSPVAAVFARSRGLTVYVGSLRPEVLEKHGPFDVTVLLDCIEHLADPGGTIEALARATRGGGHLLLTTGDWESPLARATGRRWRLMTPPQHLYFFSRRTLKRLLERHGFKVVSMASPWKIVPFGLALYQVTSRFGLKAKPPAWLSRFGVPVNLFDTVRVIARRS